ncbi:MAG: HD domain-containing protein [Patescibacteria group bacterium]
MDQEGKTEQLADIAEREARKQQTKDQVRGVGINLAELESYPQLIERLTELDNGPRSHFKDSLEIVKIINLLWEEFGLAGVSLEQMKWAAILHDIGKTGPIQATTPEQRQLVIKLFGPKNVPNASDQPLESLVNKVFPEQKQRGQSLDSLKKMGLKLNPDSATQNHDLQDGTVLNFWRLHDDWTYDILEKTRNNYPAGPLDQTITQIAASHHLLENKNPAHLPSDNDSKLDERTANILKASRVLAMVDQYQALRRRSGLNHNKLEGEKKSGAIESLTDKINDHQQQLSTEAFDDYQRVIKILAEAEAGLEEILQPRAAE